ncbi:MAG: PIN domain-containing protein [Candidatus Tectomicrobia bacterium]|nr:PIN domain-containing protein [Candidatus Tectomicrobia bacterium]
MYLLDTNALSELIKKRPQPQFLSRLRQYPVEAFYTSSICVMELRHGSSRRPDREAFWARIEDEILSRVLILHMGIQEAMFAGDVLAYLSRRGEPIGIEDVLIGSTALAHDFTVVTANVRHFQRIPNLRVENWLI